MELGGIQVPKKEWVKTLKNRVEYRLYRIVAALAWLEAGEKHMAAFEQVKLDFALAIGESERLNALEGLRRARRKQETRIRG